MKTAKKFLEDKQEEHFKQLGVYADTNSKIAEWMVEFTQIHVVRALIEASEKAELNLINGYRGEAYPLDNIK